MASESHRSIPTIRHLPVTLIVHPHAPSRMGREEAAELLPGEILLVDVDDGLVLRSAVVDHAAEHAPAGCPLVAFGGRVESGGS